MMKSGRLLFFIVSINSIVLAAPVNFEREVMPLLEHRCNKCHYPEEQRGGLDLTRLSTMLRGGDDLGPALVPGQPEESPLIQVLTGAKKPEMPKKGEKLPAAEIDLLRRWIAEGAKDDSPTFASADVAFFEREIRPVLVMRCFKCHAGDEPEHGLRLTSRQSILAGGERGAAAMAGKPEISLLMKAIRHEGELKMPRRGDKLSDAQIAAFEQWIAKGLPWPANERVLARAKQFTISDADRNHWAFRPLPQHLPAEWSIDATLQSHHAKHGLTPSPNADRHRLLRRVTYDLIGYPPTAEETAAFVNDAAPDAFEKAVTRLLDSPHFGTRWGRHWLDYTRNGSCQQSNRGPAMDSERYAAWVARCFNEDRPWEWFARVHLAGDKMPAFDGAGFSVDQALAAAVPLNGPRTFEKIETQTFILMDKLDEGIEFMGRSLMGISLECARCHDHKFDPISQRDYYALLGFFQSSGVAPVPETVQTRAEADAAVARHIALVQEKARLYGLIREAGQTLNISGGGRVKAWQATRLPALAAKQKRLFELECQVLRKEVATLQATADPRTLAGTQAALTDAEKRLRDFQPLTFDVRSMGHLGYFIHGHKDQPALTQRATTCGLPDLVPEITAQDEFWKTERLLWVEVSKFGGYTKDDPAVAELAAWAKREKEIETLLAIDPRQPFLPPTQGQLFIRSDGGLRRDEDLVPHDLEAKAAKMQFNGHNAERVHWLPPYIGDARLLLRGDALHPDQLVPRGFPVFFGETKPALEGSGRLQLAEWLTAPGSTQSALVARTAVNRAWQHLFGEALCRTPKELGRLGEAPELPELMDGLAARFISGGCSMKKLIREIVLSRAYQRSALVEKSDLAKDADNRHFARQNVRRLEYEAIVNTFAWLRTGRRFDTPAQRDAAVPGVSEYARQFDGPTVFELMDRRVASISATQALLLMNHPATAHGIAADQHTRLHLAPQATLTDSLGTLYEQILQRPPSDAERTLAQRYLERRHLQKGDASPKEEIREFITLLLCGNETLYLE